MCYCLFLRHARPLHFISWPDVQRKLASPVSMAPDTAVQPVSNWWRSRSHNASYTSAHSVWKIRFNARPAASGNAVPATRWSLVAHIRSQLPQVTAWSPTSDACRTCEHINLSCILNIIFFPFVLALYTLFIIVNI